MWMIFVLLAILSTIGHYFCVFRGKEEKYWRFFALVFTVFTVCAFYDLAAIWAESREFSAIEDVLPTANKMLWGCAIASVFLNSFSLWKKK